MNALIYISDVRKPEALEVKKTWGGGNMATLAEFVTMFETNITLLPYYKDINKQYTENFYTPLKLAFTTNTHMIRTKKFNFMKLFPKRCSPTAATHKEHIFY